MKPGGEGPPVAASGIARVVCRKLSRLTDS
jgi:hypothetical protein